MGWHQESFCRTRSIHDRLSQVSFLFFFQTISFPFLFLTQNFFGRIQHEVKRVSFDRNVGSNGLLFFVDCLDGDQSLHIWLFIRLVFLRDEQLILVNSASGCPISVHDWSCKDCSSGRECSFDYRSVMCIDEQTLQLNIQMMEQTEDSVFLYAMTLNSLEIGSLSPSITVTKKKYFFSPFSFFKKN